MNKQLEECIEYLQENEFYEDKYYNYYQHEGFDQLYFFAHGNMHIGEALKFLVARSEYVSLSPVGDILLEWEK